MTTIKDKKGSVNVMRLIDNGELNAAQESNRQLFEANGTPAEFWSALHYTCVTCGADVSPATVGFYHDRYGDSFWSKILCYDCQEKNK